MSTINLDAIRKRLNQVNQASGGNGGGRGESKFFKPEVGEYLIRLIPNKFSPENPFVEVEMYSYLDKGTVSPKNWGEPDPVQEMINGIKKKSNDDARNGRPNEDWKIAGKLRSNIRFNALVIVRGKENQGALIWKFGKEVYNMLAKVVTDPDYGNVFDLYEGRDFSVTFVKNQNGNGVLVSTCVPKPKETPLSSDVDFVSKVLEEQPDILEEYARYKKDYVTMKDSIKDYLGKLLSGQLPQKPATPNSATVTAQPSYQAPVQAPVIAESEPAAVIKEVPSELKKKDVMDDFDSYFNDEE